MTPAEIRTNLLIVAVILVVSAALFVARPAFQPVPAPATVSSAPGAPLVAPSRDSPNSVSAPETPIPAVPVPSPASQEPPSAGDTVGAVPSAAPATRPPVQPAATDRRVSAPAPVVDPAPSTSPARTEPGKSSDSRVQPKKAPVTAPVSARKPVLKKAPPPSKIPSPSAVVPASRPERPVPKRHKGTLIFVFDDAGHNLKQLAPFLALPFPCTIAVLPGLQYSREAAQRARAAGKEVILHQPMQAINLSTDPGPAAITKGMNADQIRAVVRGNLAEVGPVSGLNNHEGSLITADRTALSAVFDVIREKGIYFLDSRTNAKTAAPTLARERNMTIWERAVFLDNSQDRSDIIDMVYNGMKIAENKGAAIMIGHVWSNDLANILTSMYPELVSEGFSLSTIARIAIDGDMDE